MFSGVRAWLADNVSPRQDDFTSQAADRRKGMVAGAAVGGAVGAVAGGVNAAMDEPYQGLVDRLVPVGEAGPSAREVLGADHDRLLEAVQSRSSNPESAATSLQYLASIQRLSPKTSPEVLNSLYQTVENHFGRDKQAREVMNLVVACMEKDPQATPFGTFADFLNLYHQTGKLGDASEQMMKQCDLTSAELKTMVTRLEWQHTTLMGRFGVAGGVALGAGVGALVGAGLGAVTSTLLKAVTQEAPPTQA